jgi:hypothetical protein
MAVFLTFDDFVRQAIDTFRRDCRSAKPSPAKPINIIAQVEGSGTAEAMPEMRGWSNMPKPAEDVKATEEIVSLPEMLWANNGLAAMAPVSRQGEGRRPQPLCLQEKGIRPGPPPWQALQRCLPH